MKIELRIKELNEAIQNSGNKLKETGYTEPKHEDSVIDNNNLPKEEITNRQSSLDNMTDPSTPIERTTSPPLCTTMDIDPEITNRQSSLDNVTDPSTPIERTTSPPLCTTMDIDPVWACRLPKPPGCLPVNLSDEILNVQYDMSKLPLTVRTYVILKGITENEIYEFSGARVVYVDEKTHILIQARTQKSVNMAISLIMALIKEALPVEEMEMKVETKPGLGSNKSAEKNNRDGTATKPAKKPEVEEVLSEHFEMEYEINDLPLSVRTHIVLKGIVENRVNSASGAQVRTEGSYVIPQNKKYSKQKPLCVFIEGTCEESISLAMKTLEELKSEAFRLEESTIVRKVPVGLEEAPKAFDLITRLLGPDGVNLLYVEDQTGATVSLRGRQSGFIEHTTGRESEEPLHVRVEHKKEDAIENAEILISCLVKAIQEKFTEFTKYQNQSFVYYDQTDGQPYVDPPTKIVYESVPVQSEKVVYESAPVLKKAPTCFHDPMSSPTPLPTLKDSPLPTPKSSPLPTLKDAPLPTPKGSPLPTPKDSPLPTSKSTPLPTPKDSPLPTSKSSPLPTPKDSPLPTSKSSPLPTSKSSPLPTPKDSPLPTFKSIPLPTSKSTPLPTPNDSPLLTPKDSPLPTSKSTPLPTPKDSPLPTLKDVPLSTPKSSLLPTLKDEALPTPKRSPLEPPKRSPFRTLIDVPLSTSNDSSLPTLKSTPLPTPKDSPLPTSKSSPLPTPKDSPLPTSKSSPLPTSKSSPLPTPKDSPLPTFKSIPLPTSKSTPLPTPNDSPLLTPKDSPLPTSKSTPLPTPKDSPLPTLKDVPLSTPKSSLLPTLKDEALPTPKRSPLEPPKRSPFRTLIDVPLSTSNDSSLSTLKSSPLPTPMDPPFPKPKDPSPLTPKSLPLPTPKNSPLSLPQGVSPLLMGPPLKPPPPRILSPTVCPGVTILTVPCQSLRLPYKRPLELGKELKCQTGEPSSKTSAMTPSLSQIKNPENKVQFTVITGTKKTVLPNTSGQTMTEVSSIVTTDPAPPVDTKTLNHDTERTINYRATRGDSKSESAAPLMTQSAEAGLSSQSVSVKQEDLSQRSPSSFRNSSSIDKPQNEDVNPGSNDISQLTKLAESVKKRFKMLLDIGVNPDIARIAALDCTPAKHSDSSTQKSVIVRSKGYHGKAVHRKSTPSHRGNMEQRTRDRRTSNRKTPDRRTSNRKTPDQRTSNSKTPDLRTSNSKTPDQSTSNSKIPDLRTSNSKTPDQRTSNSKTPDRRTSNSKTPDRRTSNSKTPDQRTSNSKTPDRIMYNSKTPNQSTSNRKTPDRGMSNRKTPNRRTSNRNTPDRRMSNRKTPDRRTSNRNTPDRRTSNRKIPDRRMSNRKTPDRRMSNRKTPDRRTQSRRMQDRESLGRGTRKTHPSRSTDKKEDTRQGSSYSPGKNSSTNKPPSEKNERDSKEASRTASKKQSSTHIQSKEKNDDRPGDAVQIAESVDSKRPHPKSWSNPAPGKRQPSDCTPDDGVKSKTVVKNQALSTEPEQTTHNKANSQLSQVVELLESALKVYVSSLPDGPEATQLAKVQLLLKHVVPSQSDGRSTDEQRSQLLIVLQLIEKSMGNTSGGSQHQKLLLQTMQMLKKVLQTDNSHSADPEDQASSPQPCESSREQKSYQLIQTAELLQKVLQTHVNKCDIRLKTHLLPVLQVLQQVITKISTVVTNEQQDQLLTILDLLEKAMQNQSVRDGPPPLQLLQIMEAFKRVLQNNSTSKSPVPAITPPTSIPNPETIIQQTPPTPPVRVSADQPSQLSQLLQLMVTVMQTHINRIGIGPQKSQLSQITQLLEHTLTTQGKNLETEEQKTQLLMILQLLETALKSQSSSGLQSPELLQIMQLIKIKLPQAPLITLEPHPTQLMQVMELIQKALQTYANSTEMGQQKVQLFQVIQLLQQALASQQGVVASPEQQKQLIRFIHLVQQTLETQVFPLSTGPRSLKVVQIMQLIQQTLNTTVYPQISDQPQLVIQPLSVPSSQNQLNPIVQYNRSVQNSPGINLPPQQLVQSQSVNSPASTYQYQSSRAGQPVNSLQTTSNLGQSATQLIQSPNLGQSATQFSSYPISHVMQGLQNQFNPNIPPPSQPLPDQNRMSAFMQQVSSLLHTRPPR